MDLDTLASLSEVVGAAVVIGSIGFAFVQLSHFRRQRYDMVTVELVRSLQTARVHPRDPPGALAARRRQPREGA